MFRFRALASIRHRAIATSNPAVAAAAFFHLGRPIGDASTIRSPAPAPAPTAAAPARQQHHRLEFRRSLIVETAPELVKVEKLGDSDSGIVELKLVRKQNKNAISRALVERLRDAVAEIKEDSSANVVLVYSTIPGVFCAGADLKERKTLTLAEAKDFSYFLRSTVTTLEALPIPTIAVIEGAALGGGLEVALACDLRICGENVVLGMPETGHAIIPGAGGTQRLPRVVGRSIAKELILTGRRINGKEALSIGLVNHCVPAGEAYAKALEVAREINQKGPLALRMAKQAINRGVEVDIATGLGIEGECYDALFGTHDRAEGLNAFAEKRKPKYLGK